MEGEWHSLLPATHVLQRLTDLPYAAQTYAEVGVRAQFALPNVQTRDQPHNDPFILAAIGVRTIAAVTRIPVSGIALAVVWILASARRT